MCASSQASELTLTLTLNLNLNPNPNPDQASELPAVVLRTADL